MAPMLPHRPVLPVGQQGAYLLSIFSIFIAVKNSECICLILMFSCPRIFLIFSSNSLRSTAHR